MLDTRRTLREPVHEAGKIIFIDDPLFVDCVIRDISPDGAMVTLAVSVPLPLEVALWDERTGMLFECQVRWRKEQLVGLHFLDTCNRSKRRRLLEKCRLPSDFAAECGRNGTAGYRQAAA